MKSVKPLLFLFVLAALPGTALAQDLRAAHKTIVESTVLLEDPTGGWGTGWIVEIAGQKMIVTNRHVATAKEKLSWNLSRRRIFNVHYYRGSEVHRAKPAFTSKEVDFAVFQVLDSKQIPVPGLTLNERALVRGERVVIAGHPASPDTDAEVRAFLARHGISMGTAAQRSLRFVTTEGVVAGYLNAATSKGSGARGNICGAGSNCLVLDAESEAGFSGSAIVDSEGTVVGLLWGGWPGTSLTLAVHSKVLASRLKQVARLIAKSK